MGIQGMLLEREGPLAELQNALARAVQGDGLCVLVAGEAGIGKSTLLAEFERRVAGSAEVHFGYCDALHSPRPLGPLHDMAPALGLPTAEVGGAALAGPALFDKLLEKLRLRSQPVVLVFEDMHWADQGTIDLMRFLSRRVQRLRVLLVMSFRSDEVGPDHPLRNVLGDMSPETVRRLPLQRLSKQALVHLVGTARVNVDALYETTAGNPYYASEVIALGRAEVVPTSVRDAVHARVSRLGPAERALADAVSVVPGRAELSLLKAMPAVYQRVAMDNCLASGVLVSLDDGRSLQFRHELARRACEANLGLGQAQALHAAVLHALTQLHEAEVARLVHHALGARDHPAVLALAPRAADQAAAAGSHREAAAHLAAALAAVGEGAEASNETLAGLHERWSYEAGLIRITDETINSRLQAIERWTEAGDFERVALNCRWAARLYWYRGQAVEAQSYAEAAISALQGRPPSVEQAWGNSTVSQRAMLNDDTLTAIDFGRRAVAAAHAVGALEVKVHALNNIGSAQLFSGDESGAELLQQSLALAREHGFHEQAARVYTNMTAYGVSAQKLELAERYAVSGLEFDREHDLDSWTYYLEGLYAEVLMRQGKHAECEAAALQALAHDEATAVMRLTALVALSWLYLRTGRPEAHELLPQAREIAYATGEMQRISQLLTMQTEAAWLRGDAEGVLRLTQELQAMPHHDNNPWSHGELIIYAHRAGHPQTAALGRVAAPFALEIQGDIEAAAAQWRDIGSPFGEASVLAVGQPAQRLQALALFDRLGCKPAADMVRRWARQQGVSAQAAPRGPYRATRGNPAGLSTKELEVLRLLAQGKTNPEISDELFRAPKTVEHHVSAVLSKLGVRNRVEAVRRAGDLGLLD